MTAALVLAGLKAPAGDNPAARRQALMNLSDEELAERIFAWLRAFAATDLTPLANLSAMPLGEIAASAYGARAVALGAREGAQATHRELRRVLAWEALLSPESLAAIADPDHGVWERGKLHIGKYQAFVQDAPFATHDPAHIAKWGPHEMMHRGVGFAAWPGMSRWELYLASRLNELIPVALWYGPDQLCRLDDGDFNREATHPEARAEDAHWRSEGDASLKARIARTLPYLRRGIAHFETELAAIDGERRTGRRVETKHRYGASALNASSDATAYVAAHFERLEAMAPTFARCAELFDHWGECWGVGSIEAYRERIETIFDELLFGDIHLDLETAKARRSDARLFDLLHRAGTLGLAHKIPAGDDCRDLENLADALGPHADDAFANGVSGQDLDQLADGIASVAPQALQRLDEDESWLDAFVDGEGEQTLSLWRRRPLGERLHGHLKAGPTKDLVGLEHAMASTRTDDAVTYLNVEGGRHTLRSETFELRRFAHDVLPLHAGEEECGDGEGRYLIGANEEGIAIIPVDAEFEDIWRRLGVRQPSAEVAQWCGEEAFAMLLEAGAFRQL